MKILVLGGGLMGPAAAYNAMSSPEISQVVICDVNQGQLHAAAAKLAGKPGANKLGVIRLDLSDQDAAARLMAQFDAVVAALPHEASARTIQTALRAGTPLVDLARPPAEELPALRDAARASGGLAILACGLEPGLTEMMARHLADRLDRVDEVHIKCGGIPAQPAPPLGYKIVFGGQQLPLHESDAQLVEDGQLKPVPRYSGVEPVTFPGVGQCEAWHEGFVPWLLELPALQGLKRGTQKTVRWPGYAARVTVLKELGLLSRTPVQVNGVSVAPKALLDALLYPQVKLAEGEGDITLFRVEVLGQRQGQPWRLAANMVDRYDAGLRFTSMARTTAFTGAIVARMLARGELGRHSGLLHPEQLIAGPHFERLLAELAAHQITFEISSAPAE